MKFTQIATLGALALLAGQTEAIKIKAKDEEVDESTLAQAADDGAAPDADAAVATGADQGSETTSKIGIDVLEKGQGEACQAGQTASVHYTGALAANGKVFDSSLERGAPIQFTIGNNQVIQCWEQAIVQLHVGDKADVGCPASLSYGSSEKPGIPANSELYFNMEVVGCE